MLKICGRYTKISDAKKKSEKSIGALISIVQLLYEIVLGLIKHYQKKQSFCIFQKKWVLFNINKINAS